MIGLFLNRTVSESMSESSIHSLVIQIRVSPLPIQPKFGQNFPQSAKQSLSQNAKSKIGPSGKLAI